MPSVDIEPAYVELVPSRLISHLYVLPEQGLKANGRVGLFPVKTSTAHVGPDGKKWSTEELMVVLNVMLSNLFYFSYDERPAAELPSVSNVEGYGRMAFGTPA